MCFGGLKKMKKMLIVVDVQNDFITGALGSKDAQDVLPNIVNKIKEWDGDIIYTMDSHGYDYANTYEGKHLPIYHCVFETTGRDIPDEVFFASKGKYMQVINKGTFTCSEIYNKIKDLEIWNNEEYSEIQIIGLVTDICVINVALMIVNELCYRPNTKLVVDSSCCAGTTKDNHEAALKVMKSCLIDVI